MSDKMTAEQAQTFNGYSLINAAIVAQALEERGCTTCTPYADVFTYDRWLAQGYQVQKSEHGIKLTTYIPVYKTENGEKVQAGTRPWHTTVFCRHQVKEREG